MSFKTDSEYGNIGEEWVFKYLEEKENITNVVDLRKDTQAQADDIDGQYNKNGKTITFDVKTEKNTHVSRWISYELFSEGGTPGAHARSKADYFIVCATDKNKNVTEVWWVDTKELGMWCNRNFDELEKVPTNISPRKDERYNNKDFLIFSMKGNTFKSTKRRIGFLINIDRLVREKVAYKVK